MSTTVTGAAERPLVAVVCAVPLLFEGLRHALGEVARVQFFPAAHETAGLLRWIRPDAVIVDDDATAESASRFARELGVPLLHLSVRERRVRVFESGTWLAAADSDDATPETVRDVLAGSLYARRHA